METESETESETWQEIRRLEEVIRKSDDDVAEVYRRAEAEAEEVYRRAEPDVRKVRALGCVPGGNQAARC